VNARQADPSRCETPVGYLDLDRVRANARRVASYAAEHGLTWRPHIKTHKSREVARIQLAAGAAGLTVATPREAEVMAPLTDDLLLAYPPVGEARIRRLVRLPDSVRLTVALDDEAVLGPLARAFHAVGRQVEVLVELDAGLGRVGLPHAEAVTTLARQVAACDGAGFRGILFYPGHVRMPQEEQAPHLAEVARRVGTVLDALEAAGLPPDVVSGGSTPTLWQSHHVPGMTEIRSGSCIFFDREAVDVGAATTSDLAYTVLATVVSTAVAGRAVVDAGSKALAKEVRGPGGFGFVLEHPEVRVAGLSEEHGVLDLENSEWRPSIGDRVRLVPNHVCVSVNLQDRLLGRDGETHRWIALEGRGRAPWSG